MIIATHMLGLTALEAGLYTSPRCTAVQRQEIETAVYARYTRITHGGWLLARTLQPERGTRPRDSMVDPGRSFPLDDLAGDGLYIFLDVHGTRYTHPNAYPLAIQYGWQWDAEWLIGQGALVCADDLAAEDDDLVYAVCQDIAQTLPPLPPPTEEDIQTFASNFGVNDPALLAHVREHSTDPTNDLYEAVLGRAPSEDLPAAVIAEARTQSAARLRDLRATRRQHGAAALALLHTGQPCELLMPQRLALATALGCIEAGILRKTPWQQ